MSLWHPAIIEKQQPRIEWCYRPKSDTEAAHFKSFINNFPHFSGKHPFKCMWWSTQSKGSHVTFKKIYVIEDEMEHLDLFLCSGQPQVIKWRWTTLNCSLRGAIHHLRWNFSNSVVERQRQTTSETKTNSIFTWVMQRRKHIIVYSSSPAASGTQKGTASPFKDLTGCRCTLCFQHPQKLVNLFGSETQGGRPLSFFSRRLLSFSANTNPKFNIQTVCCLQIGQTVLDSFLL